MFLSKITNQIGFCELKDVTIHYPHVVSPQLPFAHLYNLQPKYTVQVRINENDESNKKVLLDSFVKFLSVNTNLRQYEELFCNADDLPLADSPRHINPFRSSKSVDERLKHRFQGKFFFNARNISKPVLCSQMYDESEICLESNNPYIRDKFLEGALCDLGISFELADYEGKSIINPVIEIVTIKKLA